MSDHTRAIVPIGTGLFSSPDLEATGESVDVGLLAESLIYYDTVLLNIENQKQFGDLLSWFLERNLYSVFLDLLGDGELHIFNRAFRTNPFVDGNRVELLNIVEEIEHEPNSFAHRYLDHEEIKSHFPRRRQLYGLRQALEGKVIEVKVDEFGHDGIENARRDFVSSRRCTFLLQTVLDEVYRLRSLGSAPRVEVSIVPGPNNTVQVQSNINFEELSRLVGLKFAFGPVVALSGAIIGNINIWSAQQLGCDLYLPTPLSGIVGDKLYEARQTFSKTAGKIQNVVDRLEVEVEFPDLRSLVNTGGIEFNEVLRIRKKAKRFRKWLQDEGDRDRNALFAYHFEVAKESGLVRAGRSVLKLFGVLGGPALGTAVASALGQNPILGAVTGTLAGEGTKYLLDVGAKLGEDWRPVIFGNWYKDRIQRFLKDQGMSDETETQG